MRLHAGLVPPQEILDELEAVVRSAAGRADEIDPVPAPSLHIPLALFGNVAQGDAVALGNALLKEAATWAPAELRFAGGTALEWPGDESIWAKLDGDLEQLGSIARGVHQVVQRLGFFVDRRKFRTWMSVGKITGSTTPAYLNGLVDALEAYRGSSWSIQEICLLHTRRTTDDTESTYLEVHQRIPLGGS